ncbi:MAG: GGDEF domain-containing protein [Pseudomonadota bacterium]
MKIGDPIPVTGVSAARPAVKRAATAAPAAARPDVATVMNIPESEFTPQVRAAIMALMAEVEKLRRELQQNQARIAYLEQLADQDTLTPVANRRAFVRQLSRAMSYAERYDMPSSVIYFDVNGLKRINDSHGHAAGDAVLAHVAELLVRSVRDSDFVGRLGGDEFGVILAYTDQKTAQDKAAALAAAIDSQPIEWEGTRIALTISYGLYSFRGGDDASRVLAEADRAMYAQKKGAPTAP